MYMLHADRAYWQMIVKEGNGKSSADLTLREFDDIQVSAVAFCAIYNTHRRVCRKLIEALEEKRQQYRQIPAPPEHHRQDPPWASRAAPPCMQARDQCSLSD